MNRYCGFLTVMTVLSLTSVRESWAIDGLQSDSGIPQCVIGPGAITARFQCGSWQIISEVQVDSVTVQDLDFCHPFPPIEGERRPYVRCNVSAAMQYNRNDPAAFTGCPEGTSFYAFQSGNCSTDPASGTQEYIPRLGDRTGYDIPIANLKRESCPGGGYKYTASPEDIAAAASQCNERDSGSEIIPTPWTETVICCPRIADAVVKSSD